MYDIKRAKREKNIFSSHKPVEICQKRTHLETNFNAISHGSAISAAKIRNSVRFYTN